MRMNQIEKDRQKQMMEEVDRINGKHKARQEALYAQAMGRPIPNVPTWPDHTKPSPTPGLPPNPNPGPPFPGGIPGRRPYMAGLGRFLTEARLAERLGGEHPYAYAMNNPTTYTDPSGSYPQGSQGAGPSIYIGPPGGERDPAYWHSTCYVPPRHPCATYPGGPCAYAKSIGDDKDNYGRPAGGGVVCCEGKAYPCVWGVGSAPGLYNCAFRHEQRHVQDPGGCPRTGYARQKRVGSDSECIPTLIEINCLIGTRSKNCGSNPDCLKQYHDRICRLCRYLDENKSSLKNLGIPARIGLGGRLEGRLGASRPSFGLRCGRFAARFAGREARWGSVFDLQTPWFAILRML